jgi:hypothetical protein
MGIMGVTSIMTSCFNFETNYIDEEDGKPRTKDIHLDFGLNYNFALSYFDDELREQGLDPDNEYKYKGNKKPSLSFYV